MQTALAFGGRGEFLQQVRNLRRQLGQAPGPGLVQELVVEPKILQHLNEVAFAGTEEAADPDTRLFRLVQVAQVGRQDANQAVRVLPIADEVRQFVAEGFQFRSRLTGRDLGHTLVQQGMRLGVFFVDIPIHHRLISPSLAVMGTA